MGRANVRRFFERIIRRLEMSAFDTTELVVQGDTVVVFGGESGTVRSTGAAFRNEWVQKYVVEDNRIVEMAEYNIQIDLHTNLSAAGLAKPEASEIVASRLAPDPIDWFAVLTLWTV